MRLKFYLQDPVHFFSVSGLAQQVALKKTEVTDTDKPLMFEKELEKEYVMQFIDMQKLITSI